MTTIATFVTAEDAHLFRMFLESREIEARVLDEYLVQVCWHYSNAIGGVRVAVMDEDANEAAELYQEYMEALRDGPYPLRAVRAWPLVVLLSLAVGAPLILFGRILNKPK